jgi:HK97 family phage major capsid protein
VTERTNTQTRVLTFDLEAREAGSDGIPVVISSDSVVDVTDGPEILVHTREAIDLTRAPLPIIATHRSGQVNVGIVDNMTIADGRLRGIATFGSRPEAAGYREDVLNRIIRSVSAGYARIKATIRKDGVMVTSRWMPTHIALVAEPADVNAGFFRSNESAPDFQVEVEPEQESEVSIRSNTAKTAATKGVTTVTDESKAAAGASADVQKVEISSEQISPVDLERGRKETISNLCRANKLDERYERSWIESGADINRVSKDLLAVLAERSKANPQSVTHLDLSNSETRRYSLLRALRAASNKDWKDAGLELECNREISKRLNRIPKAATSFFVPLDVMMREMPPARRDMTVAGVSGSNYLAATENRPADFIELLRNTSVSLRMGVTRLSGLQGPVTIPKMTAGNTAYWLADENTQITESQPTIAQLSLSPKNVAALTELSHQLLQQSSPDAENLVLTSIARDIGLAVDVGILRGAGNSGQPTGIITTGSIGGFTGTSLASTGVLDAIADVAAANALEPGCGFVTTPAVAGLLMNRPELVTTGTTRLWKGNHLNGSVYDYPAMASGQMATATALFGLWPSVVLAEWGVLELMTNPFSDFTRGLTAVRGWYTCDVGVRYAGAWSYASSIT